MEEINKTIVISLIMGILAASGISLSGLNQDVFKAELDGYYICAESGQTYEFARLSGSGERGYPFADSNKGYKDCKDLDGRHKWKDLYSYATEIGVDPYDFIEGVPEEPTGNTKGVWGDQYRIKAGENPVKI